METTCSDQDSCAAGICGLGGTCTDSIAGTGVAHGTFSCACAAGFGGGGDGLACVAQAIVEEYSTQVDCHTTYRLSVRLTGRAFNLHSIYGNADGSLVLPEAYQVTTSDLGVDLGGVNPAIYSDTGIFAVAPTLAFDSWLTIDADLNGDDEPDNLGTASITSFGIDFSGWTSVYGLTVTDGAVTHFSNDAGQEVASDSAPGQRTDGLDRDVYVAQITVPTESTVKTATMSFQGHTQDRSDATSVNSGAFAPDWSATALEFSISDPSAPATHDCHTVDECASSPCVNGGDTTAVCTDGGDTAHTYTCDCGYMWYTGDNCENEQDRVTPELDTVENNLVGFVTFRLSLKFSSAMDGDSNIYAIFGTATEPMVFPPVYQATFAGTGYDLGTTADQLATQGVTALEFDSWVTVGDASDALSSAPTSLLDGWDETQGINEQNGLVLWMTPDDGPQKTTMSGEPATSTVLVAQLTVAEDTLPFTVKMNVQGRSTIRAEAGVQAADAEVDWVQTSVEFALAGVGGGPETGRRLQSCTEDVVIGDTCSSDGRDVGEACATDTDKHVEPMCLAPLLDYFRTLRQACCNDIQNSCSSNSDVLYECSPKCAGFVKSWFSDCSDKLLDSTKDVYQPWVATCDAMLALDSNKDMNLDATFNTAMSPAQLTSLLNNQPQTIVSFSQTMDIQLSLEVAVATAKSIDFISAFKSSVASSFTLNTPVVTQSVYIKCVAGVGEACTYPEDWNDDIGRRRLSGTTIELMVTHSENMGGEIDVTDASSGFLSSLSTMMSDAGYDNLDLAAEEPTFVTEIVFRPADPAAPLPTAAELGPNLGVLDMALPAPEPAPEPVPAPEPASTTPAPGETPTPEPGVSPTPTPTPGETPSTVPSATPGVTPLPAPAPEEGGSGGIIAVVIIVLLLAAGGGGGAYWFFVLKDDAVPEEDPKKVISNPMFGDGDAAEEEPQPEPEEKVVEVEVEAPAPAKGGGKKGGKKSGKKGAKKEEQVKMENPMFDENASG